jgi:hypothetical protein
VSTPGIGTGASQRSEVATAFITFESINTLINGNRATILDAFMYIVFAPIECHRQAGNPASGCVRSANENEVCEGGKRHV